MAFICVLGLGVRLYFICQPLRYDEAFTFREFISGSFIKVVGDYSLPNNHILHSLLCLLTTRCLGPAEWALRLPALAAGVCLVPAMFFLGLKSRNVSAGLWAAALTASSSYLVEYSVNARGYTMICLFTAILLAAVLALQASHRSKSTWAVFILASVAGLYTVPVMAYPVCLAAVWLLLVADLPPGQGRGYLALRLAAAGGFIILGAAVCYTPVIIVSGAGSLLANRFVSPMPLGEWVKGIPGLAEELLHLYHRDLPGWMALLVAGGALLGCFRLPKLALAAVISVPSLMLIQRVIPFPRVLTFGLVVYLLLAAAGLERAVEWLLDNSGTRRRKLFEAGLPAAWALAAGLFIVARGGPAASRETGYFPEAPKVAEFLAENCGTEDVFFARAPASEPLQYYAFRRGLFLFGFALPGGSPPRSVKLVVDTREQSVDLLRFRYSYFSTFFREPELITAIDSAEIYNLESLPEEESISVSRELAVNYLEAIESKQVLELEDLMTGIRLGYNFLQAKDYEPARKICRKILEDWPDHETALHILGRVCHEQGEVVQAKYYYRKVLDINPLEAATLINMGMIARSEGENEKAEEFYRLALRADSTSLQAHFNLGNLLLAMGRKGEAEPHYRLVVEKEPGDGMAHFYLGLLYLQDQRTHHRALEHLRAACRLLPAQADQIRQRYLGPLEASLQAGPAEN